MRGSGLEPYLIAPPADLGGAVLPVGNEGARLVGDGIPEQELLPVGADVLELNAPVQHASAVGGYRGALGVEIAARDLLDGAVRGVEDPAAHARSADDADAVGPEGQLAVHGVVPAGPGAVGIKPLGAFHGPAREHEPAAVCQRAVELDGERHGEGQGGLAAADVQRVELRPSGLRAAAR